MTVEVCNDKKYIDKIVEIHMKTFTGFFLTFLGKGFLKQLYTGFMDHKGSDVIIAFDEVKQPVGFLAYSEDLSGFYKYLIKRRFFQFAWYAFLGFLRKPKIFIRLMRAFTYSGNSERKEKYIELSSIGVLPEVKNQGAGSMMIQYLYGLSDGSEFEYIKLETDKENNEGANHFYQKNGFKLDHSYETPEGRSMNEYRYYLAR